jgi:hypothetical protein
MADWRTLDRASEHGQLLTECEVLKCDGSVSAADQRKRSEHDDERGQHELSCGATDHKIKMVGNDLIGEPQHGQMLLLGTDADASVIAS